MITLHRSAKMKAGKGQEAVKFAREVAEFLISTPPQALGSRVYDEKYGNIGTIHWFIDYESLTTMQADTAQRKQDEAWLAFGPRADELFIEGSWHDTLLAAL